MILFEIILRGIIANIIGLYTRYYFLKLIGKNVSIKQLSGKGENEIDNFGQVAINIIVGLAVLISAILGIAWIYDSYFRFN